MNKFFNLILIISIFIFISSGVLVGQESKTGISNNKAQVLPPPSELSVYTIKPYKMVSNADYYVATNGNDEDCGSFEKPFATIEKAKRAVKELDKRNINSVTVAIKAGKYRIPAIEFNVEDKGSKECPITYCAYGDGEVIFDGGIALSPSDFNPVPADIRNRLNDGVADKIVQVDLKKYGLQPKDWGKLYAIGGFNTAGKYDGETTGPERCELFFNDERMTLARYPNDDKYLKIGKIIDQGEFAEFPPQNYVENWSQIRNPRGGTFTVDSLTGQRLKNYKTWEDVWLFGYFFWDWADSSTPVAEFDFEKGAITTKYASTYAFKEGQGYFIYNSLEELDSKGEWYLDRSKGIIYFYPPGNMNEATINLSLSTKNIINVNNSAYLTFKKITLTSTRSDAININGNHNNVEDCTIKNCAGSGIVVNGHNNKVYNCEIMKMGKGGILLSGGNPEELYSARNIADNNHIHHYGEIYKTYWAGISLSGVGNICSHNEIHDAPHMAIFYDGFNHLIEYNYIHDVVKNSTDAGAVYSGRSFVKYGNVLRYNCIYNIGSNEFKPQGIYFDDAFSGQIVYGNVLINIPENAILIGGGSNMDVYNNLIINAKYGIHYDDRARDGVINKGWFRGHVQYEDSPMWIEFYESPYKSMLWKKAFPRLYSMHGNFEDADSPYFAANPSLSIIKNNVILAKDQKIIKIAESVYRFSKIESNALFHLDDEIGFIDMKNGNYNLKKDSKIFREVETFENIPFEKIGRY